MREGDEKALAVRVGAPFSDRCRDFGDPRAGRIRRRERPAVLVELGVALARERQQAEGLVEQRVVHAHRLVERQPERVEQRVERVAPLRLHYSRGRSAGKRITSRIASLPVSTMASRSIPIPQPPVGGIP